VNPFYKGMDLARSDFPRSDPTCTNSASQGPLCALEWLAYAADFHAATRAAIRGITLATATWDFSAPQRYKQDPPQPPGERAVLVVVDTATAARYQVPLAKLRNRSGQYVAPSEASMKAALATMTDDTVDGVLEPNPASKDRAAYPLTEVTYAMTAPRQLTEAEAKDYAGFLRYATSAGQIPGIAPGQLPDGYVPLPASLQKQASEAADIVEERGGSTPTTGPTPTPTSTAGPTSPSGSPAGGAAVSGATPPPAPAPAPAPGTASPSASPTPRELSPSATSTPGVPAGKTRFVLLIALLLGVVAALARPAMRLVSAITTRGATSPAPSTQ
jgi:hypothetical protein